MLHRMQYPGTTLVDALDEWQLVMRSLNRSPETIRTYSTSVLQFDSHAGAPTVDQVTPAMIRAYLTSVLADKTAATAVTRWGGLLAFFKWATAEGFCDVDPMHGVERPARPELAVDILTDDEIRALLNTCRGASFDALRDTAIIRTLLTTGMRLSECATITLDRINLKTQVVRIMGKGKREREVHLVDTTALAITRYLRARKQHPKHDTNMLWIGKLGPLSTAGVKQLIERRGKQAGVPVHAHLFRHHFAHKWLAAGGTEGGLMGTAGWRSRAMLDRYGRSAAAERSRSEHQRLNVAGDF
jgi:site-specific recombinase XerD